MTITISHQEMQITTTVRYQDTPTSRTKIEDCRKNAEQQEFIYTASRLWKTVSFFKN